VEYVCVLQKYIILLEEEVIPTTDILNYFAQCLPVLDEDETLIGATAWNENGTYNWQE
jgi:GNT-I family